MTSKHQLTYLRELYASIGTSTYGVAHLSVTCLSCWRRCHIGSQPHVCLQCKYELTRLTNVSWFTDSTKEGA